MAERIDDFKWEAGEPISEEEQARRYKAWEVVLTSAEFREILLACVARANGYVNRFPYNLGYYGIWNGEALITFDCWNLVKAIINDPTIWKNYTLENHAPASGNMPDWDGWTILQNCSDVSTDFSHLYVGEFLYMSGHAGVYIGNGQVVECTTDWTGGNVLISNITSSGGRHRGGVWMRSWTWHGKLPWIDYSEKPSGKIAVDGEWGAETTRAVQKVMRVEYPWLEVDGIISSQDPSCRKYLLNAEASGWEFISYPLGSPTIQAVQNRLNQLGYNAGDEDGLAGQMTIKALQQFLNDRGASPELEVDGYMGELTVKAYQTFLNTLL